MAERQASAVALGNRALLIEGAPGIGKSSLALSLIDRGAVLIGDDGLVIEARDGRLFASPHPNTHGLIEIRNLGLVPMPVCDEAQICLAVRLDREAPRFIDAAGATEIEGIVLPQVTLWPDTANLALKAEIALQRYGLPLP